MEFDLRKSYCYYFNEICRIPHGSGNEKELSDWLVAFAKENGLEYIQDECWNVVIYKKAAADYEDHPGVIIQAHMDMVEAKVPGSTHDFTKEPLELYVDGDYLRAKDTTLGADDGMGCAYMLAILADKTLRHPYLECCFTTQEETGLVGAQALKPEYFKARRLINLDGAGEYQTYMSMGGGQQMLLGRQLTYRRNDAPTYKLEVKGLLGGHSAGVIDQERANAGKLLARVLCELEHKGAELFLASLGGGEKHNIIMPDAQATVATWTEEEKLRQILTRCSREIAEEYELSDPNIEIVLTGQAVEPEVLERQDGLGLMRLLFLLPYGMISRNITLPDCPPVTSVNVGTVCVADGRAEIGVSIRSSLETALRDMETHIRLLGELFGYTCQCSGYYPGWKYTPESEMREILKTVFFELYGIPLACLVGHGGNECGVFQKMHPDMDIVTSGAIYGNIHAPGEYLDLASFDRNWTLLTKYLEAL